MTKWRNIHRILKIIVLTLGIASVCSIHVHAQETVVLVKTYDKQLQPFANLELSLDSLNYLKTGENGTVITKVDKSLLPPKVVYFANKNLEAESWNYSKGVLEIIVRRKTLEVYSLVLSDTLNQAISAEVVLKTGGKTYRQTTNNKGLAQLILPVGTDVTTAGFNVVGFVIAKKQLDNKRIVLKVYRVPVEDKKIVAQDTKSIPDEIDALDSINSLTAFYAYVKVLDIPAMSESQKQRIDEKFRELMLHLSDSLNIETPVASRISDSSLVNEDLAFLTQQASKEGDFIKDNRAQIDESFRLINEKIGDDGTNLNNEERQKILGDIDRLGALLNANELLFSRNQSNYKAALEDLKNKLLNIKSLEKRLNDSELQRLEQQKAFRNQIFIYILIIVGLVLLILLFAYFVRKFNQQKKELSIANVEIQRINDNLENIVAAKTESLVKANQELDTFLYHTSHKLKGPITSIIGLAYVAELTLKGEPYELFKKSTEMADKMERLLNKLAMINEINQPTSSYKNVDIKTLVDKICKSYDPFVKEKNIKVVREMPGHVQYHTNPILLEIIFNNLVENALQFSSFTSGSPEVIFKLEEKDKFIRICVCDNGEGVEEEIKSKIWGMFYIGSLHSNGNGLGLYITRRAVEAINGTISLELDGKGRTAFVVKLPRISSPSDEVIELEEAQV